MEPDVLVVGAGPTGLVLSLWLARMGVRVRIVDKAPHAGTTSRAVGVQARTLELYEPLDLTAVLLAEGVKAKRVNMWTHGHHAAQIELLAGSDLSRYPYMLVYPQDRHEALLESRLGEAGVKVERGVEVTALDGTNATLSTGEHVTAKFVAGCDGAHSIVRRALGAEFEGGTYEHVFYVADVTATGKVMNGEIHVAFDGGEFLASFPLDVSTRARLIGELARDRDDMTWDDVPKRILERLDIAVTHVNWFSSYKLHHRVATTFGDGTRFLLGDAAHIHSPVGGQGMNTGIGDAINLAWKLAAVVHGRAGADILASYAEERVPFARRLVATTDRVFELLAADGTMAKIVRDDVLPHVLSALFHFDAARRFAFRTVSQIEIEYRHSPLSQGKAGRVHGGDRLPWVESADNFAPLRSLDWQVHVFGEPPQDLRDACAELRVALHHFAWSDTAHDAGFAEHAAYFVRPDGYVGLATRESRELLAYWDARRIRP
ncbi:MAG TPA: FAD-dependent monooxygenase [Kofleriaceae bacterium]|nr:FAD-dependent monooxygenase [Kofleriaceae bacterium]